MDFAPLRQLALELNFEAHGVDVTVAPYSNTNPLPIETRGIWLVPETAGLPSGAEFQRKNGRRIMALRRDEVPEIPRKTTVTIAADPLDEIWMVDSVDTIDADHYRVTLVLRPY